MTALVTGASSGLGAATALALARAGHDVAVHWRSDEAGARHTVALVEEQGRRAHLTAPLDLAIAGAADLDTACARLLDDAEALGPLDVVVINAASQELTPWEGLDTVAWDRLLQGGLRPAAALLQAAGRRLADRTSDAGGVVVTVGSIEGLRAAPGHAPYAVGKAALHHLTAAAAYELGPSGVRVVGVAPGLIDRPGLAADWPEGVERWRAASALGRPVAAGEVAAVIAFLASPAASGVTGVVVPVDAGWSAAPGW